MEFPVLCYNGFEIIFYIISMLLNRPKFGNILHIYHMLCQQEMINLLNLYKAISECYFMLYYFNFTY